MNYKGNGGVGGIPRGRADTLVVSHPSRHWGQFLRNGKFMRLLAQQDNSQSAGANEEGVGLLEANTSDDSGSENDSDYVGSQGEEESYKTSLGVRVHRSDRRCSGRLQVQFKENAKHDNRQNDTERNRC